MAGFQTSRPHCPPPSSVHLPGASGGIDVPYLEQRCRGFLLEGLAPSTRRAYSSGQQRFFYFCLQSGRLNPDGSPCPADEQTLCLFATFLADFVRHPTIKVYLSAVRSLHIDLGLQDPLLSCLRLQRVVRGIKRTQGSSSRQRLPITDDILLTMVNSLDLSLPDHCMFWAACTLAFFGFLRSAEFTVPSLTGFSPSLHLQVSDIAVDSSPAPLCMRVSIKASKTDPFPRGCQIHIGLGSPLCVLFVRCWPI